MLKEKAPKAQTVLTFKLVTGEEVIAVLESMENGSAMVRNPLAMVLAENPENPQQTRVMFTPWLVAAGKDAVEIREHHIVASTVAKEDAAEQYLKAIA